MPGQLPLMENCFVLFYFFIKPTVTGEMAVSSTELGRVTRETRQGPLGPGPCQKPEQCASQSQTRALFVDTVMVSHLYCHWRAGPSPAPKRFWLLDLGAAHFQWTPNVTSSAYLLSW